MSLDDDRLVQYVQLQVLSQSHEILWSALASLLLELEPAQASDFLRRLAELLAEQLQNAGAEQSGVAGHLDVMFQTLVATVQSYPDSPDVSPCTTGD